MVTGPRTGYCVYEIWAADPHHPVTDGILEHVEDGWSLLMRATSPDLEVSLESPSVIEYTPWFCFEEKQSLRVDCSCYVRNLWWTDEESFIDANITMVLTSKTLCWTVDDRTIKTRWLIPTHSVLFFLNWDTCLGQAEAFTMLSPITGDHRVRLRKPRRVISKRSRSLREKDELIPLLSALVLSPECSMEGTCSAVKRCLDSSSFIIIVVVTKGVYSHDSSTLNV